jgi:hypothetical protein
MILERHVALSRLDVPYLDSLVIRARQNLLIVRLETSNGTRVAFFGDPVESIDTLARLDIPKANIEIERAANDAMRVKVNTGY